MPTRRSQGVMAALAVAAAVVHGSAAAPSVLQVSDFLVLPLTGTPGGTSNEGSLARINMLREEPGGRRFFANDLNGPLYIIDKRTRQIATYLDFNGAGGRRGLFRRFTFAAGFANGLIGFQFDPDYRSNGRFYTIHLEDPSIQAPREPSAAAVPGLDLSGYEPTRAIATPGPVAREAVLIEWTDSATGNTTFEGTAREVLRVEHNTRIHPLGDMIFNPTARRGDTDWRVMYLSCGDGGAGEQQGPMRMNPQRLDTLVGKILRIIPDPAEHTSASALSENGRYRIPATNPFVETEGARGEIWAYGLRNPHRLTWDVNPSGRREHHLIATTIGLHMWETVQIVRKGANYGYPLREGDMVMTDANVMAARPADDILPVRISDTRVAGTTRPSYPVIQYSHTDEGGDAIAGGFVYRGRRLPALRGKFVFGDISTGKIWYADLAEMIAADDDKPATVAAMHPLRIEWRATLPAPTGPPAVYASMWSIVESAYRARGGRDPDLPGGARVSGSGRVDMRFAADAEGELYILSKSDGMIRKVVGVR